MSQHLRRVLRRTATFIAAIILLVIATVGAAWLYALTSSGQARIAAIVTRQLASTLPGLKVGRLGPTASGTLTAADIDVFDADGVRAVHIDRIRLRPRWASLALARRLAIQSVRLEGLDVDARIAADGTLNLATLVRPGAAAGTASPSKSSSSPLSWSVGHLDVVQGRVAVRRGAGAPVELTSWTLKANASGAGATLRGAIEDLRGELRLPGQPPEALAIDGDLRRDGELITLAGTARTDRLGSLSWSGSAVMPPAGSLGEFDAAIRVDALALSAFRALAPGLPVGVLSGRVTVHGAGIPLQPSSRLALAASVSDSRLADVSVEEVHVDATSHDDRWAVSQLIARGGGVTIRGAANGRGTRGTVRLEVAIAETDALPEVLKVRLPGLHGSGRVVATAEGGWPDGLQFSVTGEAKRLKADRLGSVRRLSVAASGTARSDRSLSTKGRLVVSGVSTPAVSLKGATLTWAVRGSLSSPLGSASLRADRLWVRDSNIKLATLAADVRGQQDHVAVTAQARGAEGQGSLVVDLRRGPNQLTATVAQAFLDVDVAVARSAGRQRVTLLAPTTVTVQTKSDEIVVSGFQARAQGPMANGDVTLAGNLGWPGRLRKAPYGHLVVGLRQASAREVLPPVDADLVVDLTPERGAEPRIQPVRLRGELNVRLVKGTAHVRAIVDAPLTPAASPSLKLASRGPINASLDGADFDLAAFPALRDVLSRRGLTGGTFGVRASVSGDLADPVATVVADVRRLEYRDVTGDGRDAVLHRIPGIGVALNVATHPDRIRASTQLSLYGGGFATVNAELQLGLAALLRGADPRLAPLSATLDLPRFQIAALRSLSDELRDTSGWLSGHGQLEGTLARPKGAVTLKLVDGRVDKIALGPVEAQAQSDGQTLQGTLRIQTGATGTLSAQTDLRLSAPRGLIATLDARGLDPGFARPFIPGMRELEGVIDAHVVARGEWPHPVVNGQVYFYRGRVGVVGEPTFHDVAATVALTPGRVDLQNLQVFSGGGSLTGKGHAELNGVEPTSATLTARARRFVVSAAGVSGGQLDGDLEVALTRGDNLVTGHAKVPSATVRLPSLSVNNRRTQRIRQHDDVRFVDGASRAAQERNAVQDANAAAPTQLKLQAEADTVFVRSKDLDLEIESRITLRSMPSSKGAPGLFGEVRVRRGRIDIVGQRFRLDESRIIFDGGDTPRLDVHLQRAYPDAVVFVDVRGTPAHPDVKFRSEPGIYDQAQIISVVLTGRASGGGGGPPPDPTAVVATTVLAKLADKLAPQLGLDVLRVERSSTTPEQTAAGLLAERVEIGKYVSERLYVSYSHVFGATAAQNANEAQAEYHVSADWLAQTVFGDAGVGGVDAFWTRRY